VHTPFRQFPVQQFAATKNRILSWCQGFSVCTFLDSHAYDLPHQSHECLVACGVLDSVAAEPGNALDALQHFRKQHKGKWIFGHFSYDLKNEIEPDTFSEKPSRIGFPTLFFYVPQYILRLTNDQLYLHASSGNADEVMSQIQSSLDLPTQALQCPIVLQERISAQVYQQEIQHLLAHIHRGDCYEINYCMEFYANDVQLQPLSAYKILSTLSPNPFSGYYRVNDAHLMCASPERYLKRQGNQLISQPIKGTMRRNTQDAAADDQLGKTLQTDRKERSENVMVVDLVRNDLSRVCMQGSVKVSELFGIYTFPQVHQMISTVCGEVSEETAFEDIIRATFPMGSMTGAPKRRVMQLIEQYEHMRREIFSGAIGYVDAEGNFDFNVVIRSLMYNASSGYLSYMVGSGITAYAVPEKEYEECLLKAAAIRKLLEQASQNS